MKKTFEEMASYLEETYGVQYDREEEFVVCPECYEPIYKCDWAPSEFNTERYETFCPICGYKF